MQYAAQGKFIRDWAALTSVFIAQVGVELETRPTRPRRAGIDSLVVAKVVEKPRTCKTT